MIPGIGGRKPMEVSKSFLCQIIQPRLEEIFDFALIEIKKSGYAGSLGAGVVITGGCALLRGVEDLAHEILGMPVKIGMPKGISYSGLAPEIETPVFSTAVGLALYGIDQNEYMKNYHNYVPKFEEETKPAEKKESIFSRKEKAQPKEKVEKETVENEGNILTKMKKFIEEL
jgi:cell division protein FtsA